MESKRQVFRQLECKLESTVADLKEAVTAAHTSLQEGVAAANPALQEGMMTTNTALQEGVAAGKEAVMVKYLFLRSGHILLIAFSLTLLLSLLLVKSAWSLLPCTIRKVARESGGGQEWPEWVTNIALEMLSHQTPPESAGANILTVCKLVSPHHNIVQELPCFSVNSTEEL